MFFNKFIQTSLLSSMLCVGFSGTAIAATKREGFDDSTKSQRIAGLVRGSPSGFYDGLKGLLGEEAFKLNYAFDKEGRKALKQSRLRDQKNRKSALRGLIRGSEVTSGKGQIILLGETNILGDMPKETALKVVQDTLKERHPDTVYVVDSASPLYPLMKEAAAGKIDEADVDPAAGGSGGGDGSGSYIGDIEAKGEASHRVSGKSSGTGVRDFYEYTEEDYLRNAMKQAAGKDPQDLLKQVDEKFKARDLSLETLKGALQAEGSDAMHNRIIFGSKTALSMPGLEAYEDEMLITRMRSYGTLEQALEDEENKKGARRIQSIIINDDLLKDKEEVLRGYFERNPNHKLLLDVGHRLADGVLMLGAEEIPETLKNLVITNVKGNITLIGPQFLKDCTWLKKIKVVLSGVTAICEEFLMGCSGLEEVSLGNLGQVRVILQEFCKGCSQIRRFDLSNLSGLRAISFGFFEGCANLEDFNIALLSRIAFIDDRRFLAGCVKLASLTGDIEEVGGPVAYIRGSAKFASLSRAIEATGGFDEYMIGLADGKDIDEGRAIARIRPRAEEEGFGTKAQRFIINNFCKAAFAGMVLFNANAIFKAVLVSLDEWMLDSPE